MNAVIGRQPILDRQEHTVAYELLFRSGTENRYDGVDGNHATTSVISNTFLEIGMQRVLGPRRGFINFTRDLLVERKWESLPPGQVVIEVLEDVPADRQVREACEAMKLAGYSIALDDVTAVEPVADLVEFVEFAKLDLPSLSAARRAQLRSYFHSRGIKVVAEKVETEADFASTRRQGFDYFQGYFFAKPELVGGQRVPSSKTACLQLIREAHRPELDFSRFESIVRQDLALARKLLQFVNSAAMGSRHPVNDIRQAFTYLGEANIRRWVTLAAMPALAADRPTELVTQSLVRARFCELAADATGCRAKASAAFLTGLFSLLDAMIGLPLESVLAELAVDRQIVDAILNRPSGDGSLRDFLDLAKELEQQGTPKLDAACKGIGADSGKVCGMYVEAMVWAEQLQC